MSAKIIGTASPVSIFDSVNQLPETWDELVKGRNPYLSTDYLKVLEESLRDIPFRYLAFSRSGKLYGIAVVQIIKLTNPKKSKAEYFCSIGNHIQDKLIASLDIRVMTCGNVFCTGENGFLHNSEVSPAQFSRELSKALDDLISDKKRNAGASIILLKEFWPKSGITRDLSDEKYIPFEIDVNMVLPLHPSWEKLDDYLDSMVTKFRTKAKGVYKKSAAVVSRELNGDEAWKFREKLEELYLSVLDRAEFRFGMLNGKCFARLKEELGDRFVLTGYFLEEEMVGFSTAFCSEDFIDAGYIGMDYALNQEYSLYQRMLYDLVQLSIASKSKELRLGRTAEEMKSSLGAKPVGMSLLIKHRYSLSNNLLKPILKNIGPASFTLRNPFKADFSYT